MPDFWRASGYHLLAVREEDGRLGVTDEFLRAYVRRPELRPVAESCAAERTLHAALLEQPRRPVAAKEIAALADPDARENYTLLLALRDRLLAADSIEAAYLGIFRDAASLPALFIDQLAHVILRHVLRDVADPLRARAGELLFRPQRVTIRDGAIMVVDEEIVGLHAAGAADSAGSLGRLLAEAQTPVRSVELDVLHEDNAASYWDRDERYDTVLELTFGRPGLDALARVLEAWVAHFLAIRIAIQPVRTITDERWVWHVGLDAEASAIMNDLYRRQDVGEERLARILALFRLDFADASAMRADIAGRPVYLGLAMDPQNRLRLKPQNLLMNLPLARVT